MSRLFLRVGIGDNFFAVDAAEIEEVLPVLVWTPVSQSKKGLAGVFVYRGRHLPLVDPSELVAGRPASLRMSTRIVLMRHNSSGQLLGFLAEHVTETFRASEDEFKEIGIANPAAPYLGRIIQLGHEMIQQLDINRLLDDELAEGIFAFDNAAHR